MVVKEESKDSHKATPLISPIVEQGPTKKVRMIHRMLLKDIEALRGALMVGLKNIILMMEKL